MRGWARFEDIRRGGHDPAARLEEMDHDGVDAEVLYPTPRLAQAIIANRDGEFHLACVQAYNDWLSEYVAYAPDRFGGLALLPNRGVEHAVAEIDRVLDRPGMRGVVIGCYPNGTLDPHPKTTRCGPGSPTPACRSASTSASAAPCPPRTGPSCPATAASSTRRTGIIELVFAGVFDRFPELESCSPRSTAAGCRTSRSRSTTTTTASTRSAASGSPPPPSEYIERHFHFGYMTDTFGIHNRHDDRRRADPVVERLPAHQRRLAATRGAPSRPRSRACPAPSGS